MGAATMAETDPASTGEGSGAVSQEVTADDGHPAFARDVLRSVIARLPEDSITLKGEITVRRRHGVLVRRLDFAVRTGWGEIPPRTEWQLQDAAGSPLEALTVSMATNGQPRVIAFQAADNRKQPDLFAPLHDTALSWADLTFSYLWWPDARLLGFEETRGFSCFVVEVRPPRGSGDDTLAAMYDRMVLWIERDRSLLVQAEAYGRDDRRLRRMWVKSIRKIGDRWLLKDLEVEGEDADLRTRLRVLDSGETGRAAQDATETTAGADTGQPPAAPDRKDP